jgi:hypothetical protein
MRNCGRILVVLSTVSVGLMPTLMASCGGSNKNMGKYMASSEAVRVDADGGDGTRSEVNDAAPSQRCGNGAAVRKTVAPFRSV